MAIFGNKENKEIDDEELKKLRNKFKEIASENNSSNVQGNADLSSKSNQNNSKNDLKEEKEVYVDPERVEENERITNLIMQQIKELIEIDNNLNIKIKEIETKLRTNISSISDIKNVVDKFNFRLEFIEKNMEKFMGLYEVVTNRFNPFIEGNEQNIIQKEENLSKKEVIIPDVPISDLKTEKPKVEPKIETVKEPPVQEIKTEEPKVESKIETVKEPPVQEIKTEEPKVESKIETVKEPPVQEIKTEELNKDDEATLIINNSGIRGKVDNEQIEIILNELRNIVSNLGKKIDERLQKSITENLTKLINQIVVESIKNHIKITNEQITEIMDKLSNDFSQNNYSSSEEINQKKDSKLDIEVNSDYHFSLHDGTIIKNIRDLLNALLKMDDNTFLEYVNDNQNDFADWLNFVTDKETADKFSKIKNLKEFSNELNKL
jgi:archaellum component FlaC